MPSGIYVSSRRGLASASQETRKRVSQIGGFVAFIRRGDLFSQERAEKGGQACAQKYGREFYRRIRLIGLAKKAV
jgi:hypothetical protein